MVTDVCVKFNYDLLFIDKTLGNCGKADNKNKDKKKKKKKKRKQEQRS